jgi:hypothetical protein
MTEIRIIRTKLYEDIKIENNWVIRSNKTLETNVYERIVTLSGQRWESIHKRCQTNGDQQTKFPRYKGTTNLFSDFNEFVEWSRGEVGYDLRESVGLQSWAYCIEKDILGNNSKTYSPDTCLFVPNAVNIFLTARNASRGDYPIGVAWKEKNKKFQAQVRDRTGSRYLGLHSDPMEGHRAWQLGKIDVGRNFALEFKDWHGKLHAGLNVWLDKIQDDFNNHRETIL